MLFENYKILLKKSDLFFCYTDKFDSYIKLHSKKHEKDDGFICGSEKVFSDFYFTVKNKKYSRKNADYVELFSDHFQICFEKIGVNVLFYLPPQKANVYFKVINSGNYEIHFFLKKDSLVIQQERFDSKEYYFVSDVHNLRKIKDDEIKAEIERTQEYYKKIEEHLNFDTGLHQPSKSLYWAQMNGQSLCTGDKNQTGIWAGLPWFKDNWGRDTFIALQGICLVNGFFEEAKQVLSCFVKYQMLNKASSNYGRIPNRYKNSEEVIYNTVDGNLWFIKSLWEYLKYSGDKQFLQTIWENIKIAVFSDLDLRTDKLGFLMHKDSDTWMDARIEGHEPLSARGNRANDIQALWFEVLNIFVSLSKNVGSTERIEEIKNVIKMLKENFSIYFWNDEKQLLADRIKEDNSQDLKIRPNQLFCVNTEHNLLEKDIQKKIVKTSFENLAFEHGVTSLSPADEDFHPYHIGCKKYHKDAAYHNGAIWLWLSGPMITSLCKYGWQNEGWKITKSHCRQILEDGCAGTLSENENAALTKGKIVASGTWSQAWSVAEFTRNFYQDYLGVHPDMLNNQILFNPKLPDEWKEGNADIFAGEICINVSWSDNLHGNRRFTFTLPNNQKFRIEINFKNERFVLENGKNVSICTEIERNEEKISFAKIKSIKKYACMKKKDYLFTKIKSEYKDIYVEGVKNE